MSPTDRFRLQEILLTFDETGLIALSNKGLVRRAQKDYAAGGLRFEESDTGVLVHGPDWIVTMPATGPGDARDDTPATGITRQILTATMFLRDQWSQPASLATLTSEMTQTGEGHDATESIASGGPPASLIVPHDNPELDSAIAALEMISWDDLHKWTTKTAIAEASALMQSEPHFEIDRGTALVIRFTQHETEVRLVLKPWGKKLGSLLDQFITTSPKAFRDRWVVAAVLALQKQAGNTIADREATSTREPAGTVQSRAQVLTSTMDLLEGLIRSGLAHPSNRAVQRLFTLSVSAIGAHLPRLSRGLRVIADEIELILFRDASGNTERLFDQLGFVNALTRALVATGEKPSIELMGRHRTEYEPVGDLDLSGVGAFPWRAASGYFGLTVLFWDSTRKRFWTWSDSRPEETADYFTPERAYHSSSPWSEGPVASSLCRQRFLLKQARANPQGRLSTSQQSSVLCTPDSPWPPPDFAERDFRDWLAVAEYARQIYPLGLRQTDPLDHIVVLRPWNWGERVFDETRQRLVWTIFDVAGRPLQITVPWGDTNESAIEFLEAVKIERDRLEGLVCRVQMLARELLVEPLSLLSVGTHRNDRILNPGFDRQRIDSRNVSLLEKLREKHGRHRIHSAITIDGDESLATHEVSFPTGVERRVAELESRLIRLAETGMHRLDELHQKQLVELRHRLSRAGLTELGDALGRLCETHSPAALLWCRYLCRLHRESATIA